MRTQNEVVIFTILCVTLLVLPLEASYLVSIQNDGKESTPASLDFLQMVPDPYLEIQPTTIVNGTSGEFYYNYQDGAMRLNWTHTAGTELDYCSEDDSTYPSFNDFVYCTQSFEWPYEEVPYFVVGDLNISLNLTGDFQESIAQLWYNVYVWLIDSSGNWRSVLSTTDIEQHQFQISYQSINEIWGGMVKNESGVQEDPEDILTIAVGLAPDYRFNYYNGQEPWLIYSGSVQVTINSKELYAVRDVEPDPAAHLDPLYNRTFKSDVNDLLPEYTGKITDVYDRFCSMTDDPAGNIYLTGESSSPYEIYLEEQTRARHQYLIKYSPSLNQRWVVRNVNQTGGRAITYHSGHLYTTGSYRRDEPDFYNILLTKWDLSGRRIWQKEWGGEHDQVGVALGVHDDGSIYVVASDYDIRSEYPDSYQNSSILKFDNSGNLVWQRPIPWCTYFDQPGELWVFDTQLIYDYYNIMAIDLDGTVLWQKPAFSSTRDKNGSVYSVRQEYYTNDDGLNISKFDPSGSEIWNVRYEINYPLGLFEEFFPTDISLTHANELLVLIQAIQYDRYTYRLLKYSLQGTLLETWTIGDSTWPLPLSGAIQMVSTSTGLIYVSYGNVWTQAFAVGPYKLPIPSTIHILLAAGGVIGVMVLVGFYVYRKKRL